jgi:hypothetical protein
MKFRRFLFALPVLAGLFALGIGAAPRYIEEIAVGGGYGNTGTWLEADGDVLSNGSGTFDGAVTAGGGYGSTGTSISDAGAISSDGTHRAKQFISYWGGGVAAIFGGDYNADSNTNETPKAARWAVPHYLTAQPSVGILYGYNSVSENALIFGGGSSALNSATTLRFNTASNNTTPTGITRLTLNSSGNAIFSGDAIVQGGDIDAGSDGDTRGVLTAWDGAGGAAPGSIKLASPNGMVRYLFLDDSGRLRIHSALPTSNTDGAVVGLQF